MCIVTNSGRLTLYIQVTKHGNLDDGEISCHFAPSPAALAAFIKSSLVLQTSQPLTLTGRLDMESLCMCNVIGKSGSSARLMLHSATD